MIDLENTIYDPLRKEPRFQSDDEARGVPRIHVVVSTSVTATPGSPAEVALTVADAPNGGRGNFAVVVTRCGSRIASGWSPSGMYGGPIRNRISTLKSACGRT